MSVYSRVEAFLNCRGPHSFPLLLALSGGADSLCLFYCLLTYRQAHGVSFHIAHVDHGWREESRHEALHLQQLALEHEVPFHLKRLEPTLLIGNLEAACRAERYQFFAALCKEHHYQGVLTGHHQNDQAETIFKRILEGAHWSRWSALLPVGHVHGVQVLRPLLDISKKEIQQTLASTGVIPFEDTTNRDMKYLRARFRESMFPRLNQEFGKEVQGSMIAIGEEASELQAYFEELLTPLLKELIRGPWGICLDLQEKLPRSKVVIKFLLRHLCRLEGFFLSRTILDQATQALLKGSANLKFGMGIHQLVIDRQRIFVLPSHIYPESTQVVTLEPGTSNLRGWTLHVVEDNFLNCPLPPSWKEAWRGNFTTFHSKGNCRIGWDETVVTPASLKKKWGQAKIPSFLISFFPLLYCDSGHCYEFLTGSKMANLKNGDPCWKIILTYAGRHHRV